MIARDCSASSLNSFVQKTESPKPQSTDMLSSLALPLLQKLPSGQWVGKCTDLKSAYRQVPVSDAGLQYSYIAYHCPKSRSACVRQMYALPFGASRAVYGYLRIAHSLWFLLLTTYCFDDFISLAESSEAALVDKAIHGFFLFLGWKVSADKDAPLSEAFSALGISVSFNRFLQGDVVFANTKRRVDEGSEYIENLLAAGTASQKELERIRGRMPLASGQLFGRLGRSCVKASRDLERSKTREVTPAIASALALFVELLRTGPPRLVARVSSEPLFIFADASYEPKAGTPYCGLGGVLLSSDGKCQPAIPPG